MPAVSFPQDRPQPFALALGGNLGEVEATLATALRDLSSVFGPLEVASLYRTVAVSPIPQPDYLNTAAVGVTSLPPEAVLAVAKRLELRAGRHLGARNAPRPLDIDLLLYDDRVSSRPELTLPHPRLAERRFVLAPLAEVAAGWRVPPGGATVGQLLAACGAGAAVERIGWSR